MSNSLELSRLMKGPAPDERPNDLLVSFNLAAGDADALLRRMRESIGIVLSEPDFASVSAQQWRQRLPRWFVDQCAPEEARRPSSPASSPDDEDKYRWSVSGWVQWFKPHDRSWRWWDAEIQNATTIQLVVVTDGFPFAWGALEWLMECAGAQDITPDF